MLSIRLIVADDHPVLRMGIRTLLATARDIEVIGEASTGKEALSLVVDLQPDVLLLDVAFPDISGIEVIQRLHERSSAVKILVLSGYDDLRYVRESLANGAAGYLLKDESASIIYRAVRKVARGETDCFSSKIAAQLSQWKWMEGEDTAAENLSQREREVLQWIVRGKTNQDIACTLNISEKTVEKHLNAIYHKLQVRSRTEAAVLAIREDLV